MRKGTGHCGPFILAEPSVSLPAGRPGRVEHHPEVHGGPSGASAFRQEQPAWGLSDAADP